MNELPDQLVLDDGCPKCNSANVAPVKYTWWGGAIGPKMFHHTKCKDCKYTYNRKTRQPNTKNIIIYSVITLVIAFVVFYFLSRQGYY
jgi:transposase-like protein